MISRLVGKAALFAALLVGPAPTHAADPPATLDSITIHLLYAMTGTLSRNIGSPESFAGWNTIIGEGASGGPADDMLVEVHVTSSQAEANMERPLVVVVRNGKGAVMARRTFKSLLLEDHKATAFVFLPNSTCAGHVTVQATLAGKTVKSSVDLNCGE
jgi:hypothetical protein